MANSTNNPDSNPPPTTNRPSPTQPSPKVFSLPDNHLWNIYQRLQPDPPRNAFAQACHQACPPQHRSTPPASPDNQSPRADLSPIP
ncbi:hypothetical protein BP00DRAFT_430543 [Aspergillus indologenus CBS 114.80]|uniref:Uncharacterized protein n=1 Tax=Aspergillus indologenus CBS 114.80 TaxID=1450541 RepID=A0A2V5ICJ2_9EURO|nr:hypothetical protein BP00DRAFT_430543 [Aspergillus indologenus CBS 114.80]